MRVRPSNRAGRPSSVSLRRTTFTLREPPREPAAPLPGWLSLVRTVSLRTSGTAPGKDWSATGRRRLVGDSGIVAGVGTGDWARRIAPGPTRAGRYRSRAVVRRRSRGNVRISCIPGSWAGALPGKWRLGGPPERRPRCLRRQFRRGTDARVVVEPQLQPYDRSQLRGSVRTLQLRPYDRSQLPATVTTLQLRPNDTPPNESAPTAPGTRAPTGPPRPPRRTQPRPASSSRRARRPRRRCRGPWSRGWPAGGRRPSGPSGCRGR